MGIASWAFGSNNRFMVDLIDSIRGSGHSQKKWEEDQDNKLKDKYPNDKKRSTMIKREALKKDFWGD